MATQSLSIFGDIVNGISGIFTNIANWFSDRIGEWIDWLINSIMKIIYEVLKVFFLIIDFVQLVFRKMAGLDTVYVNGQAVSGDLANMMFKNENVINALIALMITAVVMLFIATFVAIIRNNYNAKEAKDNAVGPVIGKAFKALFSFIFVPLVCVFGVFISNGLLATIDRATRVNDALTISGQVFSASAMSSNRVRVDSDFASKLSSDTSLNFNGTFIDDANLQYYSSKSAAEKIDDAFASKLAANGHSINAPSSKYSHMFNMPSPGTITYFDYMNTDLVFVYYDLQKFNWLFAFASCFFITAALLVAALGVIQRLFELTILFAVSPPFIALMPLDDGKAFKGWAKKFIESTVILYGTVVALNFFFIVAPIFQNIDLFGSPEEFAYYGKATCDLFNSIAQILFIMCASLLIKDFSSLITQLVTGNDKAVGLEGKGGNVKGAIGASMGAAAGAAAAGAAVSAKTHKAWKDYNSVENKQARKEQKDERKREKQNKRDATERRDARYKVLNAQHDAGEITTKDYLRASRRIQDDYRKEMGEKETMRTRARNVGSNIRTKVTGEPEREMGKAGKERLKNIYDKADQIKKDKDDYREQRKNLPLKDRANPIRKAKEIYYGDSKKTLKAYKSSEKTNYKEDINNTVAGLNLQYALGNIDSEEYKKDIKEVTKDRKNELRNKKNNK